MRSQGRPNLRQIATELGLSVTTVSRALKDGPEVHPSTIERVKAVATKAGYVPNAHGRALRLGRTLTLTAILPLETRDYLSDLMKLPLIEGLTKAAQDSGYNLMIHSTTPDEDPQESLLRVIRSGSSDGIVITRMVSGDPRVKILLDFGIPFVAFGRTDEDLDYAYVDIDNEQIAFEATRALLDSGCRRIALQLLILEDLCSAMRMEGHRKALEQAGLAADPALIGHDDFTMAASESWVGRLLDQPDPPTGLICANELGLLGALSALHKRGLVPGRDIQIIVRDNTLISQYLSVPVGAHVVDIAAVGRQLVEALLLQITTPAAPKTRLLMPAAFRRFA
jgi:LacI family transcriptional regulator